MARGPAHNRANLVGQTFNSLTVIASAGSKEYGKNGDKKAVWLCKCECGNTSIVDTRSLKCGGTKSCGCRMAKELRSRANPLKAKHPREYRIWQAMLNRCRNQNTSGWRNYGGRGIGVCEEWFSFDSFIRDMGPCPEDYSIERVDNDSGYSPSNCVWADQKTQSANRRNVRPITFNGRTKLLKDWAQDLGMDQASLRERIEKWPLERALTEPPKRYAGKNH